MDAQVLGDLMGAVRLSPSRFTIWPLSKVFLRLLRRWALRLAGRVLRFSESTAEAREAARAVLRPADGLPPAGAVFSEGSPPRLSHT